MAEVTVEKGPQKTRDEEKERDPERLGRERKRVAPAGSFPSRRAGRADGQDE